MLTVEVENRSGVMVDEGAAVELACSVVRAEGIDDGELGLAFVGADEMQALKREHLGIDEPTDVLSFPIDGRDPVPEGVPRALGDVVICPQVVGDDHGEEMERREQELLRTARPPAVGSTEAESAEAPTLAAPEQ